MYEGKTVAIVVPAHNEEKLIGKTIDTMPDYVDYIVVVDDYSTDDTAAVVREKATQDERVILIQHEVNKGVGGAIGTGYKWARDNDIDATGVMAGDNQMHPDDLPDLLDPIVKNQVDYSKGNRLITGDAWNNIPRVRYLGNAALSFLTKIASGYWHVADSQCGYTVINLKALKLIPLDDMYARYGMPNDLLVTLNIYNLRVCDVSVRPIYADEVSELNIRKAIFTIGWLMIQLFFKRMIQKYIIRDFHPLVLFYAMGAGLLFIALLFFIRLLWITFAIGDIPDINFLAFLFCAISGSQLILFAMFFDMQYNEDLKRSA